MALAPHDVTFFATSEEFRAWLDAHHATAAELWVGFHKVGSGIRSISWPESVDEALCYGWIDGVRKRIDDASYTIRFTARKSGSTWSAVNVTRVGALTAEGRMRPAGLEAFARRAADNTAIYAYENRAEDLAPEHKARLRAVPAAAAYWDAQPPSYRRAAAYWVTSAKRQETRERRFETLLEDSAHGRLIPPYRYGGRQ